MVNDVQGIEVFLALGDAVWVGGQDGEKRKTARKQSKSLNSKEEMR